MTKVCPNCQLPNRYEANDLQWETWRRNWKQTASTGGRHFILCRACGYKITLDTKDDHVY